MTQHQQINITGAAGVHFLAIAESLLQFNLDRMDHAYLCLRLELIAAKLKHESQIQELLDKTIKDNE